ncbi:MAG: glutamate--tRNA ligase [Alphaproteobacteria bacterium]|nr:glutamate--tRNA ligase [Alphaproteobacteria bacterium]
MTVVTRFAPSPTGYLHIGGARTALFNWLFAKHHGGKYLLRIEDTDRARSTPEAVDAILDGLSWLGLDWDGETVFQFARAPHHAAVARGLLETGHAYRCFATPEELEAMRADQKAKGQPMRYDGRWRDRPASDWPDRPYVVRLKAPTEGQTVVHDLVQGDVTVDNAQMDDMVLLRADGTPTYMLSVVVDDHDMGVTHVIRGDDHLTNAFRQTQLYRAFGWEPPQFGHIPLIHGPDGAKLSKRHGALGVDAYRDMGYLPEALRNYLLRLGWSHGDEEIISTEQAIAWFDVDAIGRSPSRMDFAKLANVNGHYLRAADDQRLVAMVVERLGTVDEAGQARLLAGMAGLKQRAKTVVELAESAAFYVKPRPLVLDTKATAVMAGPNRRLLQPIVACLHAVTDWQAASLEAAIRALAEAEGVKLGDAAQPLRAAVTGSTVSPPVFEVLAVLGRDEALGRLADALG